MRTPVSFLGEIIGFHNLNVVELLNIEALFCIIVGVRGSAKLNMLKLKNIRVSEFFGEATPLIGF